MNCRSPYAQKDHAQIRVIVGLLLFVATSSIGFYRGTTSWSSVADEGAFDQSSVSEERRPALTQVTVDREDDERGAFGRRRTGPNVRISPRDRRGFQLSGPARGTPSRRQGLGTLGRRNSGARYATRGSSDAGGQGLRRSPYATSAYNQPRDGRRASLRSFQIGRARTGPARTYYTQDNSQTSLQAMAECEGCGDPTPVLPAEPATWEARVLDPPQNLAARGARRVLATMYQNCDAVGTLLNVDEGIPATREPNEDEERNNLPGLDPTRLINVDLMVANNRYLRPADVPVAPGCPDVRSAPPVFHVGGRASTTRSTADGKSQLNTNLFSSSNLGYQRSHQQVRTLDCSGLISAAYASEGLKFFKTGNLTHQYSIATRALLNIGQSSPDSQLAKESCLAPVELKPNSTIKAGDIFVYKNKEREYGHSLIFDHVGDDPFALGVINNASECNDTKIIPANFQFTVIESAANPGRRAAIRTKASEWVQNATYTAKAVFEMAVAACMAKFAETAPIKARASKVALDDPTTPGAFLHADMAVLRHKDDADCKESPGVSLKLQGESCLGLNADGIAQCKGISQ